MYPRIVSCTCYFYQKRRYASRAFIIGIVGVLIHELDPPML